MPAVGNQDTLSTIEIVSDYPDSTQFRIPDCRMKDAATTQDWVRRLIFNDEKRSAKRARVDGLVGGNPPYRQGMLRKANRADAANFNAGTARSYMESSSGSFYDLSSEAPSIINFRTSHGASPDQRELWSNIATKEANRLFYDETNSGWDYEEQLSQWDMVLHGCGPLMFEDNDAPFPRAVRCSDLKVPEFTKSETKYWEACFVQMVYYPPELYRFIKDEKAARDMGWDVKHTQRVIANAMGFEAQRGVYYDWDFYQQELKNNSLSYYLDDDNKINRVSHCFWKEFDGRITHAIVERDTSTGLKPQYLFLRVGRYKNFQEAIHPIYFDRGHGGYHHSVTGLGVKMYSAMEYENRLICNLCDKAFAPKILFNPTTAQASQSFEMVRMGEFAVMPKGFEMQQTGVAGLMQDGIAMREQLMQVMQSTLSTYKQGVSQQKTGNPVTKFEKQLEAAMQSALSMPQFNRYYKQRDSLMAEIWRRLTNPNTTDDRCKEFQKRCHDQGVPIEALCRPEYVGATRVIGQGSAFMRKQAIDNLQGVAGALPEQGRTNWVQDKIAAEAGQAAVLRYYPKQDQQMATDDQAEAMQWVAAMKVGVPPIVTNSQNPVTYAATFLKAATDALQSLRQGGDPHEVLVFLEICGPAIIAQLKRFAHDPTRAMVYKAMIQQWEDLAKVTDKLKQAVEKRMEARKQQQQKTQSAMTDEQLKTAKTRNDIVLKTAKTQAQLRQSEQKHRLKMAQGMQDLQLADSRAASEIHLNRLSTFASISDNAANGEGSE